MEISSETAGGVATAFASLITLIVIPIARRFIRSAHARTQAEVEARAAEAKARERERALEREDRQRERDACEARFMALGAEIREVRSAYNIEVVSALRDSSIALTKAAASQDVSNGLMDRLCRRFEGLPCARDAAEKSSAEKTPLSQKHG